VNSPENCPLPLEAGDDNYNRASVVEVAWLSLLVSLIVTGCDFADGLDVSAEYLVAHFAHYLSLALGGLFAAIVAYLSFLSLRHERVFGSKFGLGCSFLLCLWLAFDVIGLFSVKW
jgi:hypothetical protein